MGVCLRPGGHNGISGLSFKQPLNAFQRISPCPACVLTHASIQAMQSWKRVCSGSAMSVSFNQGEQTERKSVDLATEDEGRPNAGKCTPNRWMASFTQRTPQQATAQKLPGSESAQPVRCCIGVDSTVPGEPREWPRGWPWMARRRNSRLGRVLSS